MTLPQPTLSVLPVEQNAEVARAIEYLMLRDQGKTMDEIAEHFGYSGRGSMYALLKRWKTAKILDKAQEHYGFTQTIEIEAAVSKILEEWGLVLLRVKKIALMSKSDKIALEAASWLKSTIVDPALQSRQTAGDAERQWAEKSGDFNPNEIVVPPHLMAKVEK